MKSANAQGSFDDILAIARPDLRPICKALRKMIVSLDPDAVEVVWPRMKIASFGVGPKKMSQHYAYIAPQSAYVNLGFYHGASLPDPSRLLDGAGKELRHVNVADLAAVEHRALKALLRAAINDRRPHADGA